MVLSRAPAVVVVLLLSCGASAPASAQQTLPCPPACVLPPKPAPIAVMPECKGEQMMPPRFVADGGPPAQRWAQSLAGSLKAGFLDIGAYRGAHTSLRVELCHVSTLLARGERDKAKVRLEETTSYIAAIINANKAVQIKAERERMTCLDTSKGAFETIQQFETRETEQGQAAWKAHQNYQNLEKARGQWDGEIERIRGEIRRDVNDYNAMVSKPFYEIRALFTGSSDRDDVERQLTQLQENLNVYNKQKGQVTLQTAQQQMDAQNAWARQRIAFQQRQEAEKKLGVLLSTISDLALNKASLEAMDRGFTPLTNKIKTLAREINYAPDQLRDTIEKVRVVIKERVEAFPRVAEMGCRPGTFSAGAGPQW